MGVDQVCVFIGRVQPCEAFVSHSYVRTSCALGTSEECACVRVCHRELLFLQVQDNMLGLIRGQP